MAKKLTMAVLTIALITGIALAQTPVVPTAKKDSIKTPVVTTATKDTIKTPAVPIAKKDSIKTPAVPAAKKAEPAKTNVPATTPQVQAKPAAKAPSSEGGHFLLGMQAGGCKLIGGIVDQSTIGVTGSLMVGYAFNAKLSARLMGGIGLMGAKTAVWDSKASDYKTTVIPISADVLYRLTKSPGIAPYLLAGVGYLPCTNELSANVDSLNQSLDASNLMFGGGLGVQFPLNRALSLFIETRYDYFGEKTNNSGSLDTNSGLVRASVGIATNLFSLGQDKPALATITGKVIDKNQKPLAATVSGGGVSARTNPATGEYTLSGITITATPVIIKAEAGGFISNTISAVLTKKNRKTPLGNQIVKLEPIPINPALVTGAVIDYKTGSPLPARIAIKGAKTVNLTANTKGQFSTSLDPGKYDVAISADGYNDKTISITAKDNAPMTMNYGLVKKKEVFAFENINFALGKADILPATEPILNNLLKVLQDNPDIKVEIAGHTDNIGSIVKNQKLSQARAESVVKWLINRGIFANKMVAVGYGSSKPVASNKTKVGRSQNRRIEIIVLEQVAPPAPAPIIPALAPKAGTPEPTKPIAKDTIKTPVVPIAKKDSIKTPVVPIAKKDSIKTPVVPKR